MSKPSLASRLDLFDSGPKYRHLRLDNAPAEYFCTPAARIMQFSQAGYSGRQDTEFSRVIHFYGQKQGGKTHVQVVRWIKDGVVTRRYSRNKMPLLYSATTRGVACQWRAHG